MVKNKIIAKTSGRTSERPGKEPLQDQRNSIIDALKRVQDPEIGIDVHTLGLVYAIEEKKGVATITMTLTTPMCPYGPMLIDQVRAEVSAVEGIRRVIIDLTFDPPWEPSPELRSMLGI